MSKFAFLLGRKPLISLAELQAVVPSNTNFEELNGDTLILETTITLDQEAARQFLNRLGGSIKIMEITKTIEKKAHLLPSELAQMALERFKGHQGKAKYAIFLKSLKGEAFPIIKSCLMETKKILKAAEISSRFINNNFANAEIAALKGENVLNRGAEFCAIEGQNGWYLGHTLAIQDIDAYSTRDYNRPERDSRLGMLPPKLAQIMINLSGIAKINEPTKDKYLYDPFCGMGTVLMEGLLMGFQVIGSDHAPDILQKAQKNLEWECLNTNSPNQSRLFLKDATKLSPNDLPESISAVVSETYLGPPMTTLPDAQKLQEIFSELEHTIGQMLEHLHKILPKDSTIVLTLLTYRQNHGYGNTTYLTLDKLLKNLPQLGFELQDLISPTLIKQFKLPPAAQKTLLYERPDQTVCRGIYKLKSKSF